MASTFIKATGRRIGVLALAPIAALTLGSTATASVAPDSTGALDSVSYTFAGIADWDRDGHQDIVARQDSTGDLWLYPGQSLRGPGTVQRVQIGNGWGGFTFAGIADWDRDGHQDIVTRQDNTGDLWLYPGQSLRGPGTVQRVQIGNGWGGYTFAGVADWDRDGHQDIVTRQDSTGDLWLYPGQSLRGPGTVQRVQIGNGWGGYTFADIADWDRDGHQDIVTRQDSTGDLWLYPGQSLRGPGTVQRVQIGNGW